MLHHRTIWLGALALTGLFSTPACDAVAPPLPPHPELKPADAGGPGWKITRRYSVSRVLIVEVECSDRERAMDIAKAIVGPVQKIYDEALVYVRPQDLSNTRRVQWTGKGGFRILDY